jgi:oxygen-independent coproporphyrinogen-3 oxidase
VADSVAIYVHFPWCVRKCPYCDFNSHPLRGELLETEYLTALLADIESQLPMLVGRPIGSVFFGGGTPSLFTAEAFARILHALEGDLAAGAEVTMEANPGTLEHKPLEGYLAAGINRLSLGAQSFNRDHLRTLGRIHGPDDIVRSFTSARDAGFRNINLDLMYALPAQSVSQALGDLEQAISLAPEHVSWYQLTLEPKTEFHARPPVLPEEDDVVEMEDAGRTRLDKAGYQRYEVSAYAREGRQCRHNLNYWSFGDYLGAGAGAHGKIRRAGAIVRTEKPSQPRLYLAKPLERRDVTVVRDELAGEFLLNALRLVDGVSVETLTAETGLTMDDLQPAWQRLLSLGLVQENRVATTALGFQYLDTILSEFIH